MHHMYSQGQKTWCESSEFNYADAREWRSACHNGDKERKMRRDDGQVPYVAANESE